MTDRGEPMGPRGNGLLLIGALLAGGGTAEAEWPLDKPEHGRLSHALHEIARAAELGRGPVTRGQRYVDGVSGWVTAVIVLVPGAAASDVSETVRAAGGWIEAVAERPGWVKVKLPPEALRGVSRHPRVARMRAPHYPSLKAVSEGVAVMHADSYLAATGANGAGVTVGVLDTSYSGAQGLLGTELPADTAFLQPVQGGGEGVGSAHGTACAEVIHDIAPGARLVLATFQDDTTWFQAAEDLVAAGARIISHSIGFDNLYPPDGNHPFALAADEASANGALFVTAAGNEAEKYFQGTWSDTDANEFMEFGGVTELLPIFRGSDTTVRLRWDDPHGTASHDYDLLVVTDAFRTDQSLDNNPAIVAISGDAQYGSGDPIETVFLDVEGEGQFLYVVVRHDPATPTKPDQQIFIWADSDVHPDYAVASSTLTLPGDSREAVAVGAVDVGTLVLESFSSRGPTADGRVKPDLVAPDGVTTSSYGPQAFWGTSSATPHASGAAALLLSANPFLTVSELRDRLYQATSGGLESKDNEFGHGLIDLSRAP